MVSNSVFYEQNKPPSMSHPRQRNTDALVPHLRNDIFF